LGNWESIVADSGRKRASVYTLGCRLNQAETAIIAEGLREAGYTLVPFGDPAELGIINTCTVTAEADAKSRKMVRAFIRKNPQAFVAVVGCYAELAYQTIALIEGVDLIVGNREKLNVLDYVAEGRKAAPIIVHDPLAKGSFQDMDFTIEVHGTSALSRRANLKIQDGCDSMCAYCLVPYARGRPRSRDIDNLLEEARCLIERGVRELVLTGVNVGRYEFRGQTLVDVIDRLDAIDGLARIRISSVEMSYIPEALFGLMEDPTHALVPFLHVPLQSGSDMVLKRMNRRHTAADFRSFVGQAHEAVHGLCIGTDILVGMPGETEEDFNKTCRILEETAIAYAHVFRYSQRPGTPAAHFPDKVDPKVLKHRSARARQISAEKRRRFHEQYLGKTLDVLFEQAKDGQWAGYTGNYIRVAVCSGENLANCIRPVVLERPCGARVLGRLCDG